MAKKTPPKKVPVPAPKKTRTYRGIFTVKDEIILDMIQNAGPKNAVRIMVKILKAMPVQRVKYITSSIRVGTSGVKVDLSRIPLRDLLQEAASRGKKKEKK